MHHHDLHPPRPLVEMAPTTDTVPIHRCLLVIPVQNMNYKYMQVILCYVWFEVKLVYMRQGDTVASIFWKTPPSKKII